MKKRISTFFLATLIIWSSFAQWPSDPMENHAISTMAGEQAIPKVATSTNGITYMAWFSNEGNYNVRLQKLDVFGNILWEDGGLLISDHPAMTWLTEWDMTIDYADHAILTFQDIRNGNNDVFAYRISPDGEFIWGANGIEMSTGPAFDVAPKVCITDANNACFAWQADDVVILQKISPEGDKLWGESGITLSGSNTYSWPQLLAVNNDEIILKYFEDSGPVWAPTRHVFAQRYDADGMPMWENDVIISNAGGISAWTQIFPFINDGNNGFFMAWHDDRDANNLSSTFVQHISGTGEILLGDNGTEASTMIGRHNFYPFLALPPGSEDIFVFWNEMDGDQNNRGIYGQKISAAGDRVWTDNGKSIIEISSTNVYPFSASQTDEDMIIFYEEYFDVMDAKVKAMRLDTDGEFVWEEEKIDLCSVASEKVHPVAGDLYFGQWISAWEDDRNGNKDIYAQNIKVDGTLGPVSMAGEFEIHPDSLVFEELYIPQNISLVNNTLESVIVNDLYFEIGCCVIDGDPLVLPIEIESGDSLIIPIMVVPGVYNKDNYVIDHFYIETPGETFDVLLYVNENIIIGNVGNSNISNIKASPNPTTSFIKFDFNDPTSNGQLIILDKQGIVVWQTQLNGQKAVIWDGKNKINQKVKSGTYFYRIVADKFTETGKLIIL